MRRRDLLASGLALPLVTLPGAPRAAVPPPGEMIRTHGLSLLDAPSLPPGFSHFPWVNPDAPKGGEIALTAIGSFDSFNPFILRGTAAVGIGLTLDPLIASNLDEPSTEYGHLAHTIEIAGDRRSVAFELREEARWHDGRPVTAEDVVWTFDTLRTQGRPFYRAYWGDVTEAVAEGPRRVVFRFRTNENRELAQILGQISVLPKHWWEGRDFTRPITEPPLGSGPYRIARFEQNRTVVYERVPDYWARDLGTRRGLYNFDRYRYEYFRDTSVAFEAFRAGQIDWRTENIARDWATGYDFPARRRGLVRLESIPHQLPTGMQAFVVNLRRPLFQDQRVRRALIEMFDFEWMNANLFFGTYTRTSSFYSNSEFAATGLPEGEELAVLERFRGRVPDAVFTTPYMLPTTDGSGSNRDGARRALELLREAGWTVRNRRLVNAQNQPFTFEILLSGPSFERVALPYVQWLQRVGIEARVRTVDPAQYQVRMDNFDYDMTVDVIPQSLSPGNEQRDFFTCEKARQNGSQNIAGFCDPAIDELVELVISAPNRAALVARTRALDRVLLHNDFVIPQWHIRSFQIAWWDKFGRPPRPPRYGLGLEAWWVDPERERALAEARRAG
ncbi:MAG: extracellular solute-binding protein [Acetobacteraceae bacterium]